MWKNDPEATCNAAWKSDLIDKYCLSHPQVTQKEKKKHKHYIQVIQKALFIYFNTDDFLQLKQNIWYTILSF